MNIFHYRQWAYQDAPSSAKFPVHSAGGPARWCIYCTVVGGQAIPKGSSLIVEEPGSQEIVVWKLKRLFQ